MYIEKQKGKKHKKGKQRNTLILILVAVVVALSVVFCIIYINDYYRSEVDIEDYQKNESSVQVTEVETGLFLDGPGEENALIFYPGAKVEYTAYLPLFYGLAEQGVDCFLVEMPGNLAILGMEKADGIMEKYTYENWYLSGHSLGGAMAASFASKNLEELDGLILLAAYPTASLQSENSAEVPVFSVLSLYGSEDGVLNQEKLVKGRTYMPEDYEEICMDGGNHAWFGNYGEQEGDKKATITREEQQKQAVEAIWEMIESRRDE